MSRMVRAATAAALGLAAAAMAASPAAQTDRHDLRMQKDLCTCYIHGSTAERDNERGGPHGAGGGGGKPQKTCSKVFAKWSHSVAVYVSDAGAPAGFANALSTYADNCYDTWACSSGLTFSIVNDPGSADIAVGWGDLGSTGILGQTSTSYFNGIIAASNVVMNSNVSSFNWTVGPTQGTDADGCFTETLNGNTASSNYDLLSVLLHEIGHSLGVSHPTSRCSTRDDCYIDTMNPCTDAEEYMRRTLADGDILSIQTNYGL
jgi:matrixin